MKRLSRVDSTWSAKLAYAIGLITTDGNLSKDGRHINFTTKDRDLADVFKKCLNIKNKTSRKARGYSKVKKYYVVQFSDKNFYEFLLSLGLTPAKSKTINSLRLHEEYFKDFLRGCIDGDGNINVFNHPESQYPQLRVRLFSGSQNFLNWIKENIENNVSIGGGWIKKGNRVYVLNYAKSDAQRLLRFIYYREKIPRLHRKYMAARPFLGTIIKKMQLYGFSLPAFLTRA